MLSTTPCVKASCTGKQLQQFLTLVVQFLAGAWPKGTEMGSYMQRSQAFASNFALFIGAAFH